jgi:small subunit ribosomal protein S20
LAAFQVYRFIAPLRGRCDRSAPDAVNVAPIARNKGTCFMANTSSAKKAARQMVRRTEINKARSSRLKSSVRSVEDAIAKGDKAAAATALKAVEPILARTAQKGVIKRETASRKVSRLTARVKAMA